MSAKQVVVAGLICLSITPDLSNISEEVFNQFYKPGCQLRTGGVKYSPGGAVANIGLPLHQLGIPVRLVGKIGDDPFGDIIRDRLNEESSHLADDLVTDLGQPTGITIQINPPGSEQSCLYYPGTSDMFYASDLPPELLEQAHIFHFGSPLFMRSIYRGNGAELISILGRARRSGLSTSLDFSLPSPFSPTKDVDWLAILENILPLVDLIFFNADELLFVHNRALYNQFSSQTSTSLIDALETKYLETMADWVLSHGVKALVLMLNQRGIYLHTADANKWQKCGRGFEHLNSRWHNRQIWVPASTTTSTNLHSEFGGASIAGFLAGIIKGANPENALRMAIATGFVDPIPDWSRIWSLVETGWDTHPLDLSLDGWLEDQVHGVWTKPPERSTRR